MTLGEWNREMLAAHLRDIADVAGLTSESVGMEYRWGLMERLAAALADRGVLALRALEGTLHLTRSDGEVFALSSAEVRAVLTRALDAEIR